MRPEHAALNGMTLPPTDEFWESYYPPNGWRCRCTVVQVRKKKYPATPHDEAMALGEAALELDKKGMFRFNPGKQERVFPAYNAYTQEKCVRCKLGGKATLGKVEMVKIPDYQNCQACKYLKNCLEAETIIARHEAAEQIKDEKQKIPVFGGLPIVSDRFITGKLVLLRRSLQDVYEHGLKDATLMKWLSTFTPQSIHDWTYEGWGESSEAAKMAEAMGIQFDAAAIKAAGGMQQFLAKLDDAVKQYANANGMLEQEIYGSLFGSAESLRALIPLTGELKDKFVENVGVMGDSAGISPQKFVFCYFFSNFALQIQ